MHLQAELDVVVVAASVTALTQVSHSAIRGGSGASSVLRVGVGNIELLRRLARVIFEK